MTSLAKYAILATIQKQLPLALWHSRYSVGGRVRTKQKPRDQRGKKTYRPLQAFESLLKPSPCCQCGDGPSAASWREKMGRGK